ncbi:ATP-binding cassette domain-containing protein [Microbacterium keratanolyticum]
MPDGQVLEFSRVTKSFGTIAAVSDLSARIEPGAVTGFLGPNGAGKTTSLRILLGQIRPTSGTATIGGVPYSELRHPLRTIGAVLEDVAYRPRRTAVRQLTMAAKANGIALSRVDEVIRLVGLGDDAETRIGTYSLGMRQRLSIASALLGDPGALVLDEPANGLDPAGIRWMRMLMRRLADEGRTVLVSSHVLSEIEQVADNVLVISKGRLVYSDGIEHLVDPTSAAVVVDAEDRTGLASALHAAGAEVELLRSGLTVRGSDAAAVGAIAASAGIALTTLQQRGPTLEDVFLQLVNEGRLVRTQTMAVPVQHAPELDAPVTESDEADASPDAATEAVAPTEAPDETDAGDDAEAPADSDAESAATSHAVIDEDADLAEDDAIAAAELGLAVPAAAASASLAGAGFAATGFPNADAPETDADSIESIDDAITGAVDAADSTGTEPEAQPADATPTDADAAAESDHVATADPLAALVRDDSDATDGQDEPAADAEAAPVEPSFDDLIAGVALTAPVAPSGFGTEVLLDAWHAKEESDDADVIADETPIAGITLNLEHVFATAENGDAAAASDAVEDEPVEEQAIEPAAQTSDEATDEFRSEDTTPEEAADSDEFHVELPVTEESDTADEATDDASVEDDTPSADAALHANVALTAPVTVEGHEGFDIPVLDDESESSDTEDEAPVATPRVTQEPSTETGKVEGIEVFDTLGVDILHLDEDGNIQTVEPSPRASAGEATASEPSGSEASDTDADDSNDATSVDDSDDAADAGAADADPRAAAMSASLAAAARAYFQGDDSDAPSYTPGPATAEEAQAEKDAAGEETRAAWAVAITGVIDTVPLAKSDAEAEAEEESSSEGTDDDADETADNAEETTANDERRGF